jgi:hypothetical protein
MNTTTRTAAKKSTPKVNADNWRKHLMATIRAKAALCGADVTGLQMDTVTTDATWGDRIGLVFHGASDEVCERAARFFEAWASKNLRALGVVGGYQAQSSIGYVGAMIFTRYQNGAKNWSRDDRCGVTYDVEAGTVTQYGVTDRPVEMKRGWATSYVYYPCAD